MVFKAQIISGSFEEITIRKKTNKNLEIGELLVIENNGTKILYQVTDIYYGSQISPLNIEKISGYSLDEEKEMIIIDKNTRVYILAKAKPLLVVEKNNVYAPKSIPELFSFLREIKTEDIQAINSNKNPFYVGNLRNGNKDLKFKIKLDGEKILTHHILITGTTGKGKSVLMKNILWEIIESGYASSLVFDPHNEYYGLHEPGLKDYPDKRKVKYYSPESITGGLSLKINLKDVRPEHLDFLDLTGPQRQAISLFHRKHADQWIKAILLGDEELEAKQEINELSLSVVRRKLKVLMDLDVREGRLLEGKVFSATQGSTTIDTIIKSLCEGETVLIDTSQFYGETELLIASIITHKAFRRYKYFKNKNELEDKPIINIVLEEAPRVIGKEILSKGPNIFSTIAREGRKFRIGLTAITQLPSLIPKQVLANINTKIILGTEMNVERQAIIESSSQDLSKDSKNIATLDRGEAIITSNFSKIAIPLKIRFFDEMIRSITEKENSSRRKIIGLKQ